MLAWVIGAALALGVVIGLAVWVYLRRSASRRKLRRVFKRLGSAQLRNVVLPDGVGGEIQVDCLLRQPERILVLDIKNMHGVLFGGEQIDEWTQIVERRSYRFPNPLPDNRLRCQAVQALAGEVAVLGRVVFTDAGEFPRGVPEGVSTLDSLPADLPPPAKGGAGSAQLEAAWAKLLQGSRPA